EGGTLSVSEPAPSRVCVGDGSASRLETSDRELSHVYSEVGARVIHGRISDAVNPGGAQIVSVCVYSPTDAVSCFEHFDTLPRLSAQFCRHKAGNPSTNDERVHFGHAVSVPESVQANKPTLW